MRVGRRMGVALAGCAAIVVAASGCGSSAFPSSRLSDGVCSYTGDSTPTEGPLTVKLENDAAQDGSFAIGEIAAGASVDDLEAYMARERRRIAAGKTVEGPPAFYTEDVRLSVPAGTESQLTGDVLVGKAYALICLTEDKKGRPLSLYVATPLTPSG